VLAARVDLRSDDLRAVRSGGALLDRTDYDRAHSYAPELLTDSDVRALPVPPRPTESHDPLYQRLGARARPSVLLISNIWRPSEYLEATTAYEELSVEKFMLFAAVCQRLGAKRLEVTEIQETAEDGAQKVRAALSLGAGRGEARLRNATSAKVARRLKANWSWPGAHPDVAAAWALVQDSGLAADHVVMGLVNQRGYVENPLDEHRLELDLSSEAKREVEAAVKIQSIARKLGPSFDTDWEILKSQTHSIQLSLHVFFT
jgi:hypothetical protein